MASGVAWRIPFLAATAIALGAAALRARGLFADLWLDEIWSLNGAFGVRSWWDIFVRLTIDNNHHLNTLYLLLIGDGASAVQYRLLAFVTGVLAVLVAAVIAARDGRASAVVAALLFGSSYLLVFYSSEARGYAPVVLFSLVAWLVVLRHAEAPSTAAVIALSACTLAGVMAHRSYGFFLVGAYVWFDFHQQRRSKIRAATRLSLRTFAVPLALVLAFAVIAFRNTTVGGGPAYRLHTIIAQTLSSLGSGPAHGWAMWLMAALVAVLFAAALIDRWHARDDRWVLYLTSVVLIPAVLGIAQPSVLTPRYFIVPAAFALLAISIWLGRAIERGGIARAGCGSGNAHPCRCRTRTRIRWPCVRSGSLPDRRRRDVIRRGIGHDDGRVIRSIRRPRFPDADGG